MDCQATSHFSASQCDFPSITGPISPGPIYVGVSCPAQRLLPQTLSGASSQARRTLPAYAPPLRGPGPARPFP
jgi:hypothetical protein